MHAGAVDDVARHLDRTGEGGGGMGLALPASFPPPRIETKKKTKKLEGL